MLLTVERNKLAKPWVFDKLPEFPATFIGLLLFPQTPPALLTSRPLCNSTWKALGYPRSLPYRTHFAWNPSTYLSHLSLNGTSLGRVPLSLAFLVLSLCNIYRPNKQ